MSCKDGSVGGVDVCFFLNGISFLLILLLSFSLSFQGMNESHTLLFVLVDLPPPPPSPPPRLLCRVPERPLILPSTKTKDELLFQLHQLSTCPTPASPLSRQQRVSPTSLLPVGLVLQRHSRFALGSHKRGLCHMRLSCSPCQHRRAHSKGCSRRDHKHCCPCNSRPKDSRHHSLTTTTQHTCNTQHSQHTHAQHTRTHTHKCTRQVSGRIMTSIPNTRCHCHPI